MQVCCVELATGYATLGAAIRCTLGAGKSHTGCSPKALLQCAAQGSTVLFRPSLRSMWPVTPLKRCTNSSSWSVTCDEDLISSDESSLSLQLTRSLMRIPGFEAAVLGLHYLHHLMWYLPLMRRSPEKFLYLAQMSHSSRLSVTWDSCRRSSLQRQLWRVTEELVEIVQYSSH